MAENRSAIVLDRRDNVATALVALEAGDIVAVDISGRCERLILVSPIPMGHKFSLAEMEAGSPVLKYGAPIGYSTRRIARGEHVHVHNVTSRPERIGGDRGL